MSVNWWNPQPLPLSVPSDWEAQPVIMNQTHYEALRKAYGFPAEEKKEEKKMNTPLQGQHKSKHDRTGKFFSSTDEENYEMGPFDTQREAEAAWSESYSEEDDSRYIGMGKAVYVVVDGKDVIEALVDESPLEDVSSSQIDDWCDGVTREQWAELTQRLTRVTRCWLEEVGEKDCFTTVEQL